MWRLSLLAVCGALLVAACAPGSEATYLPEWDATTIPTPSPTSMPSIATPDLPRETHSPTGQPHDVLPTRSSDVPSAKSLAMAELLSTAIVPTHTLAPDGYVPPPPMPTTHRDERTEFGIQINACDHGVDQSLPVLKRLHLRWVKLQVRWGDMQASRNHINWACTDEGIPKLRANGFKVLASVVTAPAFLRMLPGINGPPGNMDEYALFLQSLVARYPRMIQAIEVWNEPNLSAEWDWQIDGAVYRHLLASAYVAIKALDPSIMVISGALAPTGFGSVWTHVDDHSFIAKFRRYNGDAYTDCVGAHANGPEGIGDIDRVASNTFAWFDQTKPICVTEFGYGLPVQSPAPKGFEWIMRHTTEGQVKTFTNGFVWARSSGYVRLVIVWNLDYWGLPSDPNTPYALVRPGWESPAIEAIAQLLGQSR